MKILRVDLQKALDNIKNKIEGYPRVERRNISPFSFCKQFGNIPTSLCFSRNLLRERPKHLHLNNTLPLENCNWDSSRLQLTQKELVLAKTCFRLHHSVFWPASGRKSRWNITAKQKTAIHKYCSSTNQRKKKQNLVFEHIIRQAHVSCPPSPRLNTGKRGMIAS